MKKNVYELLSRKYPPNEYALMTEVSDAAGFNRSNSADYIAVALWPSRGLSVTGIELKSHRNDWLRELKKPDKAENIFRYCDYFYLLTTDASIAKLEEIPATWGWLNIKSDRIKIMKAAPLLTPIALSKSFVCAMLKRAGDKTGFVLRDSIQDVIDENKEAAKQEAEREKKDLIRENQDLKKRIYDFEKAAGLRFHLYGEYMPENLGRTAKFLHEGGLEKLKNDLVATQKKAEDIATYIQTLLK